MEPVNLTEEEIELALNKSGVTTRATVGATFLRFLASQIIRSKNFVNIPLKEGDQWEAWYKDFISHSLKAFDVFIWVPGDFDPIVWFNSSPSLKESTQHFLSSIVGTVRDKQATVAKQQDATGKTPSSPDPPGYSSSLAASSSPLVKTPTMVATVQNPRPPIRFLTTHRHLGSDPYSDMVYLYFHSLPSLQLLLKGLRKRHELRTGDKIVSLRVKVPYAKIRVMIGEEQDEWDWEGAMEVLGDAHQATTIIFEVQPE